MKNELKCMALVAYWLFLLGVAGPYLISAASTELVTAGFLLLVGSAYATHRLLRRWLNKGEVSNESA